MMETTAKASSEYLARQAAFSMEFENDWETWKAARNKYAPDVADDKLWYVFVRSVGAKRRFFSPRFPVP